MDLVTCFPRRRKTSPAQRKQEEDNFLHPLKLDISSRFSENHKG